MSSLSFFLVRRARCAWHENEHARDCRHETGRLPLSFLASRGARALPALNLTKREKTARSLPWPRYNSNQKTFVLLVQYGNNNVAVNTILCRVLFSNKRRPQISAAFEAWKIEKSSNWLLVSFLTKCLGRLNSVVTVDSR